MALNTSKCNHLTPLRFKGLMQCVKAIVTSEIHVHYIGKNIFQIVTIRYILCVAVIFYHRQFHLLLCSLILKLILCHFYFYFLLHVGSSIGN